MLEVRNPQDLHPGMLLELRRKGLSTPDGEKTDGVPERFVALVTSSGPKNGTGDAEVLVGERVARLIYRGAYKRSSWQLEDIEDVCQLYLGIDTVYSIPQGK